MHIGTGHENGAHQCPLLPLLVFVATRNMQKKKDSRFLPHWLIVSVQDSPNRTGTSRALDCGAGIGRITKRLLLPLFKAVDMVDVTEDFLNKARSYLGEEGCRVRNYFCCGLQDFSPETGAYDVIWIQWVIGEPLSSCA